MWRSDVFAISDCLVSIVVIGDLLSRLGELLSRLGELLSRLGCYRYILFIFKTMAAVESAKLIRIYFELVDIKCDKSKLI